MWCHSSQDTPDKQDSTQYKRAAVVATGALAAIATGRRPDGGANHQREPGAGQRAPGRRAAQGGGIPGQATTPSACMRRGRKPASPSAIKGTSRRGCSGRLARAAVDPAGAAKGLAPIESSVDKTAAALADSVRATVRLHAQRLNTQPIYEPQPRRRRRSREPADRVRQRATVVLGLWGARGGGARQGGGRGATSPPGAARRGRARSPAGAPQGGTRRGLPAVAPQGAQVGQRSRST